MHIFLHSFLLVLSVSLGQSGPLETSEYKWTVPTSADGKLLSYKKYDSRNYYISTMSSNWLSAVESCIQVMGEDGTLLSVEEEDEWIFINTMLEKYSTAADYWTSGLHNPGAGTPPYSWKNGKPIHGAWIPWLNAPSAPYFPTDRVAIGHASSFINNFKIDDDSRQFRYICELQQATDPTIPKPCDGSNDLIILVDSSETVTPDYFQIELDFASKLAGAFSHSSLNRIGLIRFADTAVPIFDLYFSPDQDEIPNRIRSTAYSPGGTRTDLAIDAAVAMVAKLPRGVPKNVVVLTDGESNNPGLTVSAADRAKQAGLNMHAVGIGMLNDKAKEELKVIAGGDENRVFTVDSYDNLVQLLKTLSEVVCP